VVWFAARVRGDGGIQILVAGVSLVPAVIWGSTTHTIIRHIPSNTGVKWIVAGGIIVFVIVGVWGLVEAGTGVALSAAGAAIVLLSVGISEGLTRIASGFPTSVPSLVAGVLIVAGLIWAATKD
jgi:hypothetical protein